MQKKLAKGGFRQKLSDSRQSVVMDFSTDSKSMLIAFGGIMGALAIPPFEFFNLTKKMGVKKMYLRDLHKAWYHRGLLGISKDIEGTKKFIEKQISNEKPEKVVMVGNSAGGYAALLFGALIKEVTQVLAFAPQTVIGPIKRFMIGDGRWKREIRNVYFYRQSSWRYFDLKKYLNTADRKVKFRIYFDPANRLDRRHAIRVATWTSLVNMPGGHNAIKFMRDSGKLKKLLTSIL